MVERTLAIIKPDAVKKRVMGDVIQRYEAAGLTPVAMKMMNLSKSIAEGFYAVHRERPFFNDLTTFMSSGPSVVLVLEREKCDPGKTEILWERLSHKKQSPGRFERRMGLRSRPMRFMDRILLKQPDSKLDIFFPGYGFASRFTERCRAVLRVGNNACCSRRIFHSHASPHVDFFSTFAIHCHNAFRPPFVERVFSLCRA